MGLQLDLVSIIVYIVIFVLLYFIVFVFGLIFYYWLGLYGALRTYTIDRNPDMQPILLAWSVLYSRPVFAVAAVALAVTILIILICYVAYLILQLIFWGIIIDWVPPLRRFERAGIFRLVDDVFETISKIMPTNWVIGLMMIFLDIARFATGQIIDISKLFNPDLDLEPSKFVAWIDCLKSEIRRHPDKFTWKAFKKRIEERGSSEELGFKCEFPETSKTENFANKETKEEKENKKQEKAEQNIDKIKVKDMFTIDTTDMIKVKSEADMYKNFSTITPDMSMTERMSTIFSNQMKKIKVGVGNIDDNVKLNFATLPGK